MVDVKIIKPQDMYDTEAWQGLSFNDLCALEIPETKLMAGLIPEGTNILGGSIKTGKSALLEWYACQIAKDKPVCYFAFEYSRLMLTRRIQKLQLLGANPNHLQLWCKQDPRDVSLEPLQFVERKVAEVKPYLVIVDTLATVKPTTRGDYQAEYAAASMVTEIAHREGVNLIASHHTRKKGKDDSVTPAEDLMGSQGIGANFDNVLLYDRPEGLTRLRGYGRMIEDFEIFLDYDNGMFEVTDKEQIAKEILKNQFPTGHEVAFLLMDGPRSINELVSLANAGRTNLDTHLTKQHVYNICDTFRAKNLVTGPKQRGGLWTWTGGVIGQTE